MSAPAAPPSLVSQLASGPERPLAGPPPGDPTDRRLLALDAALGHLAGPPARPGPALRAALDALAPVARPSGLARALPVLGAALLAWAASPWLLGLSQRESLVTRLPGAALLGLAGLGGLWLGFSRGAEGLGPSIVWRRGYPSLAALAVVIASQLGGSAGPALPAHGARQWVSASGAMVLSPGQSVHDPMATLGESASAALLLAAVLGGLTFRAMARTVPVSPGLAGANAGIASALLAAVAVQLTGDGHTGTRLMAMAVPMVLSMVIGSLVGRRTMAP